MTWLSGVLLLARLATERSELERRVIPCTQEHSAFLQEQRGEL